MFHECLNSACMLHLHLFIQYILFQFGQIYVCVSWLVYLCFCICFVSSFCFVLSFVLYRVSILNSDEIHIPVCVSWLSQQLTKPPDLILRFFQTRETNTRKQNKQRQVITFIHTQYLSPAQQAVPVENKSVMWRHFST